MIVPIVHLTQLLQLLIVRRVYLKLPRFGAGSIPGWTSTLTLHKRFISSNFLQSFNRLVINNPGFDLGGQSLFFASWMVHLCKVLPVTIVHSWNENFVVHWVVDKSMLLVLRRLKSWVWGVVSLFDCIKSRCSRFINKLLALEAWSLCHHSAICFQIWNY